MRLSVLAFVLSTVLARVALPTPDEPWFTASTLEILAGGTVKLSWHWNAAARGYLSSRGLIDNPSGGAVSASPDETTSYVLILEAPGQPPRVLTQRVVVRGAKGSSGKWPSDPFTPLAYQADYDIRSASLVALAAKVQKVLQDDRGFEIRQFSQGESQLTFITAFLQSSKLNAPNESPRRFRRIAHRVLLASTRNSGLIHVNLSSSIEWRIVVDTRWFVENSSSSNRYQKQTTDLWDAFQSKLK